MFLKVYKIEIFLAELKQKLTLKTIVLLAYSTNKSFCLKQLQYNYKFINTANKQTVCKTIYNQYALGDGEVLSYINAFN